MIKQFALEHGSWQTSRYLLNYDADCDHAFSLASGYQASFSGKSKLYLEDFLKHCELSDKLRIGCLASCWDDLDFFTDLISRIWPYNEFYEAAVGDQRLSLAMAMLTNAGNEQPPPSPSIFNHLCESLSLAEVGSSTTAKILLYLALGLGHTVWHNPDVASKWYSAILNTVLRLNKALLMPKQQPLGNESFHMAWAQVFSTATPFTNLFLVSMLPLPDRNGDPKHARQHKIGSRLAKCEKAVQMWLNILQASGLDLVEYGKQERQRLKSQDNGGVFEIFRDVWHDRWSVHTTNGLFEVRLIGFEYGSKPRSWRLWWSEPTDELVGDFWRVMEPEPLRIPGSWDEDL